MAWKRHRGLKDFMRVINALRHRDGAIMPTRHCRRGYYDEAKYMPSKRVARLRHLRG